MKHKLILSIVFVVSLLALVTMNSLAKERAGGKTTFSKTSSKAGDAYVFRINNITMPMNSTGTMANVTVGSITSGQVDGKTFLFSGGFIMSGLNGDSMGHSWSTGIKPTWAFGEATASRIEDVLKGRINSKSDDNPQIYVVDELDPAFGKSWQDWADAVKLGADFYDGDKDGIYSPVDKNGNRKWDPTEDRPDLVADQTAWTVYHDGKQGADRNFTEAKPQGIEIQQSVFGFRSAGLLGNMIFLRYRLFNRGTASNSMDSVYFGVWADPDLGNFNDDLVGCDTSRNGGFTYNNGPDNVFGDNPPCFFIDFFQGPIVYIPGVTFTDVNNNGVYDSGVDTPIDTALDIRGPVKGKFIYPGAKNVGLSSFVNYIQSNPTRGDPDNIFQARNYNIGRLPLGTALDPCSDPFGTVFTVPCASVDKKYWYSGDPTVGAKGSGWIYTTPGDMRQMQNCGPFKLEKDKPVDIVVAYIIGRGSNAKSSITEAKKISDFAQFIYDRNFSTAPPPPQARPVVRTTDNTINLTWETAEQVNYRSTTVAYDVKFEGFEVYMYRTNSTAPTEGGIENSKLIAKYDIADNYDDILSSNGLTGERTIVYRKGTQLDSNVYKQSKARVSLTIDTDPFTGGPLIKNKPYYISIVGYAVNVPAMLPFDSTKKVGNYIIDPKSFIGSTANVPIILTDSSTGEPGIRPGFDSGDPSKINAVYQKPPTNIGEGNIVIDEVFKSRLTGDNYEVSFLKDSLAAKYGVMWRLKNLATNKILIDSQKVFALPNADTLGVTEGFTVRVVDTITASVKAPRYSNKSPWFSNFSAGKTGAFYLGKDLFDNPTVTPLGNRTSNWIKYDTLRQIQIRFGQSQKAYRYVGTGFGGNNFIYAAGVTSQGGGKGFIDVPFQVWVKDDRYGEARQLACAVMENGSKPTADGKWDPTTDITASREYIVAFNRPYAPDSQMVYTGTTGNWAQLYGWTPAAGLLSKNDSTIARNQWLDAMYAVGFERKDSVSFYTDGDTLTVPITYALRPRDKFVFSTGKKGGTLTQEDLKSNFQKVTVFPNPLFAYNSSGSYSGRNSDEAFVTFGNLPREVTIKIYSLAGNLLRVLSTADKGPNPSSPTMIWDLHNSDGLRVASGMYIAVVSSPGLGEKVLKLAVIMPQKQIQRY